MKQQMRSVKVDSELYEMLIDFSAKRKRNSAIASTWRWEENRFPGFWKNAPGANLNKQFNNLLAIHR